MYVNMSVYMYVYMYMCMYVYMYVCMCVCVCMHVCVCVVMYMQIYMYSYNHMCMLICIHAAAILVFRACTFLTLSSLALLSPSVAIWMSQSKFGPPCPKGALVDVGKMKKLAQRVGETLTQMCLFAEPKQLDPCLVLVAPLNRLGAPPNKRHVHFGILKSFLGPRVLQDQACYWHLHQVHQP